MGLVRAPRIGRQTRATAEWGVFYKAYSPCVTRDFITLPRDEDPCLRCKGCTKCDYRQLGHTDGCEGYLYGSKHKPSDGRIMQRILKRVSDPRRFLQMLLVAAGCEMEWMYLSILMRLIISIGENG